MGSVPIQSDNLRMRQHARRYEETAPQEPLKSGEMSWSERAQDPTQLGACQVLVVSRPRLRYHHLGPPHVMTPMGAAAFAFIIHHLLAALQVRLQASRLLSNNSPTSAAPGCFCADLLHEGGYSRSAAEFTSPPACWLPCRRVS